MIFTVAEMEMLCLFHAGTQKETLEFLRYALPKVEYPDKRHALEGAIGKLSSMSESDHACIAFTDEG